MQVTPASEWRKPRQGVLVKLPSGRIARLRAIAFDIVAASGKIPDFLTPIVERTIQGGSLEDAEAAARREAAKLGVIELMAGERKLLEIIAMSAFVEPKVVEHPKADDEISPEDIDGADLRFVMQVCQMPADELRRFSDEQVRDLEFMGDGEQPSPEAQPDAEPQQVAR